MSMIAKVVLGASIGAAGVAGWLGLTTQPPSDTTESVEAAPPTAPVASDAKTIWEQRRRSIRQVLPPTLAMPVARDAGDRERREYDDYRELVRTCLEDLGSHASGALTLDVTKIGAPDIGTIYESVDVVETTFDDAEALQCVIQSMYAWVGEAPAESFERRYTSTGMLGTPTGDVKHQRTFEYVVGAHIGEVRFCEKRGKPDAADAPGHLRLTFHIEAEPEGRAKARTVTPRGTDLPPEVVDCIATASRRWLFPAALVDKELTYDFVLPVPGRGPR